MSFPVHKTFNQVVRGSRPRRPTSITKGLLVCHFFKSPFVRKLSIQSLRNWISSLDCSFVGKLRITLCTGRIFVAEILFYFKKVSHTLSCVIDLPPLSSSQLDTVHKTLLVFIWEWYLWRMMFPPFTLFHVSHFYLSIFLRKSDFYNAGVRRII